MKPRCPNDPDLAFWPPYTDKLRLLPTDTNLSFSIFVDHTFAECFFAGGRTVLTRSVGRAGARPAAGMAVVGNASAGVPLTVEAADVWKVDSIWINPEEVLRGDGRRQQQRDGCPDDPWILEQSTHGGERAAGDQDWRGATQGRHQHRCRTQQHGISSWTLIH